MIGRETLRVLRTVTGSATLQRALAGYMLFSTAEFGVWVAILVYGYGVDGAAGAALAALVGLVPATFFAPLGSVLGDRMKRERALAVGYAVQALAHGLTAAAMLAAAPVWIVYVFAAFAGCSITLTRPVYGALLASLCRTPEELTGANAVSSWSEGLGVFAGPMAAGALLAVAGPGLVFGAMAAAQGLAAVLAAGVAPQADLADRPERREDGASFLRRFAEGLREARREPGALMLVGLVGCQYVIVGMLDVLVVELAYGVLELDPSGPGLLTAAVGVGGLGGAASAVLLMGRRLLATPFLFGALANGVPLLLVGLPLGAAAAVVLLALAGGGKSFADVSARTLLQRTVRDDVLARVFGLQEALAMAGLAAGTIAAPLLVAWLGGQGAFVAAGLFLPGVAALAWTRLRSLDARAVVPGEELALLGRVPILAPLTPLVLERLCSRLEEIAVADGEVVTRQGEPGEMFYVIAAGECEVTVDGRHRRLLGPGDCFGEIALVRSVPRTAGVTARGPGRLLGLRRDEFVNAVTGSRRSAEAADATISRWLAAPPD